MALYWQPKNHVDCSKPCVLSQFANKLRVAIHFDVWNTQKHMVFLVLTIPELIESILLWQARCGTSNMKKPRTLDGNAPVCSKGIHLNVTLFTINSTVAIPLVTQFWVLRNCVTKGKRSLRVSERFLSWSVSETINH